MEFNFNQDHARCAGIRRMLSEHLDNSLSARQAWDVEKHLAGCRACAAEAREMMAAIELLRSAPRFDTGDDFMARLHARLDTIDPAIVGHPSVWDRIGNWIGGIDLAPITRRVPAVSLGLAVAAVALVIATNRPVDKPIPSPPNYSPGDGVHASVASSANSPFTDPAADNLEFRSGSLSTGSTARF